MDAINSLTASQCTVMPSIGDYKSGDQSIDTLMPILDINRVDCNCSRVREKPKIFFTNAEGSNSASGIEALPVSNFQKLTIDEQDEQEDEEEIEDMLDFEAVSSDHTDLNKEVNLIGPTRLELNEPNCSTEVELYSETFTLKGCSYHEHFQRALTEIKHKLINGETVPVQLHFEPVNRRDENAIVVHACLGNCWKPNGYVPGIKVAKVTHAVNNQEITKMTIDCEIPIHLVFVNNEILCLCNHYEKRTLDEK